MEASKVRQQFLEFFKNKGHTEVPSASLIPHNDPTLYFVNAGMVPFKDMFLGKEKPVSVRMTSSQRCLRVSGKHNDLENVGRTPRHHTFFEMLGNFSIGDYFKEEAIPWAWELLTEVYKLDADKLWVTVHHDDDETYALWRDKIGFPEARLQRLGDKDNFWSMGDIGPCGPCTEIHYDQGESVDPGNLGGPATESDRYMEIWNNVFMQYQVNEKGGEKIPLARPSIDTGMGLERITAVLQGQTNNYDTDAFLPMIHHAAELIGTRYGKDANTDVALRVLADHARASTFMIYDGIKPTNEGRSYVLRRIMRRALRFSYQLGMDKPFLNQVCGKVIERFKDAYPQLEARATYIQEVVEAEEVGFLRTIDRGLSLLNTALDDVPKGGKLDGDTAFKLYDTYGFPLDLTEQVAEEHDKAVDNEGFTQAMTEQKNRGRKAWKGSGEESVAALWGQLAGEHGATTFTGYDEHEGEGVVIAIVTSGDEGLSSVRSADQGEALVLLDRTPFYGESGGQAGDTGTLDQHQVIDCTKASGLHLHKVSLRGTLSVGDKVHATVDDQSRDKSKRNHTATHLLHAALRAVLGDHVTQKGSLVAPNRLRFDFSHHKPLTADQICAIEAMVNEQILNNTSVQTTEESLDKAMARGAMALFGEKYDADVRVVAVPGFSTELCGGTHVVRTGDIGVFHIVSSGGIGSGILRIEAQTGTGALDVINGQRVALQTAASRLKTSPAELQGSIDKLLEEKKALELKIRKLESSAASAAAGDLVKDAKVFGDIKVLVSQVEGNLRDQADRLRDQLGSSVVVLAGAQGPKVQLLVATSKDLAGKQVHAGNWIKELAPLVSGRGGGRPDMAQAGGTDASGIPAALDAAWKLATAALS